MRPDREEAENGVQEALGPKTLVVVVILAAIIVGALGVAMLMG